MVRIVKEAITKTYKYTESGEATTLTLIVEEYHYDTENEKIEHREEMFEKEFTDNGQVRQNIGTMSKPVYMWFGSYHKYEYGVTYDKGYI